MFTKAFVSKSKESSRERLNKSVLSTSRTVRNSVNPCNITELIIYSTLIIKVKMKHILAVTCDFQKCGILTCIDSDEPVQPPFKLRNSR